MYVLNFLQNLVLIIIQRASVVFMNALLNDNHDLWLPPAFETKGPFELCHDCDHDQDEFPGE